ncbi:MAG: ABC transporter ATP-binding protein [Gemmatimonadota bacterium]
MADIRLLGIDKRYEGGVHAVRDLDLEVADGTLTVLLGPSGCGKSTVLRLVAGLESPTAGEIHIGGRRVDREPPHRRDVAMVFQSYALYGHMTVRENIEFPLRMRDVPRRERAKRAAEIAELLELTPLLDATPGTLSGGQQQRVAMGRALVRRPAAFLLDEPLSNLDARLRVHVREEIRAIQRRLGVTTVHVTHDQVEALSLGDRVAVMKDGRLQQYGPGQELYDRPKNTFVATFLGQPGMNLLEARLRRKGTHGAEVVLATGERLDLLGLGRSMGASPARDVPDGDPGEGDGPDAGPGEGDPVTLGVRPEAVDLADADGSAEAGAATISGTVGTVEELGSERILHLALPGRGSGGDLFAVRLDRRRGSPRPGDRVHLALRAEAIRLFDVHGDAIDIA